jgi:PleD family two-component response regulator
MQGNSATPEYFDNLRVMVVDDQEYMRSLLRSILNGLKVGDVQAHGDAAGAYKALARFDPTLILTDWEMKPVDGLRFVRRIRMDDDSPNRYVPIVMVTGHNHVDKVRQARDAGANDFLMKPVSAKSVYARIKATMENPRPFVRGATYFGPDRRRRDMGPPSGAAERRTDKSPTVVAA